MSDFTFTFLSSYSSSHPEERTYYQEITPQYQHWQIDKSEKIAGYRYNNKKQIIYLGDQIPGIVIIK